MRHNHVLGLERPSNESYCLEGQIIHRAVIFVSCFILYFLYFVDFCKINSLDFSSFYVLLFSMWPCPGNSVGLGVGKMNWRKELSG